MLVLKQAGSYRVSCHRPHDGCYLVISKIAPPDSLVAAPNYLRRLEVVRGNWPWIEEWISSYGCPPWYDTAACGLVRRPGPSAVRPTHLGVAVCVYT
jgi:hypothetical protein